MVAHGRLITFNSDHQEGFLTSTDRISVIRPDGSGRRHLTRGTHDTFPVFSPSGRRVLFVRGDVLGGNWRTVDVAGRHERFVRPRALRVCPPHWTPDGNALAAVTYTAMKATSSPSARPRAASRPILRPPAVFCVPFSWQPQS